MKTILVKDVGTVIFLEDYVKSIYDKNQGPEGKVTFKQSNTQLKDYALRTIAISRVNSGWAIGTALSKDIPDEKVRKSGRNVACTRIKNLISNRVNVDPEDRGITWIPYSYQDLLTRDPLVYQNIYGPIDPASLKMAITLLDKEKIH